MSMRRRRLACLIGGRHMQKRPFRVLSIDGGGIRGIIPAVWLDKLEDRLEARGQTLAKSFDLICGTSTGSILAAAVACEVPMNQVIAMFRQRGPEIFRRPTYKHLLKKLFRISGVLSANYSHKPLESALREVLGNVRLNETKTRLCIPAYDIGHRRTFFFRSYDSDVNRNEIWKACLSSSSAPTYFPVYQVELEDDGERFLVDGGISANNPSGVGIAEAIAIQRKRSLVDSEDVRPIQLISMGTGSSTRNLTPGLKGNKGSAAWASSILDVMFDGSADVSANIAEQVLDPNAYVRLQFELKPGLGNDDLDNASKENMKELQAAASNYLAKGGKSSFDECLAMLIPPKKRRLKPPNVIPILPESGSPPSSV